MHRLQALFRRQLNSLKQRLGLSNSYYQAALQSPTPTAFSHPDDFLSSHAAASGSIREKQPPTQLYKTTVANLHLKGLQGGLSDDSSSSSSSHPFISNLPLFGPAGLTAPSLAQAKAAQEAERGRQLRKNIESSLWRSIVEVIESLLRVNRNFKK